MTASRAMARVACALGLAACGRIVGIEEIVEGPCEPNEPIDFAVSKLPSSSSAPVEDVEAADLDGDGRPDLVVHRRDPERTSALIDMARSDAKLASFTMEVALVDRRARVADVNGDGRPDLVSPCSTGDCLSVYVNTTVPDATAITLAAPVAFPSLSSQWQVTDLTGDGKPDVLAWLGASAYATLTVNTTTAAATAVSFAAPLTVIDEYLPVFTERVDIVDLDGDGKLDVLVTLRSAATDAYELRIARNTSTEAGLGFAPLAKLGVTIGAGERRLAADVDGNGQLDLVIGGATARLWLNTTGPADLVPRFVAAPALGCAGDPIAAHDVDGDGKLDIVVADAGLVCVLRNTSAAGGPASFSAIPVARAESSALYGIADVNHDGLPDMVGHGLVTPLALLVSGSHCDPPM